MGEAGIASAAIMSFPSYAGAEDEANTMVLEICEEYEEFLPIFCLNNQLRKPDNIFVAIKWHWIGGVPDSSSNYDTLERGNLEDFVNPIIDLDIPVIFEEELKFTEMLVDKFPKLKLVVPHLGGLGGIRRISWKPFVMKKTSISIPR